MTVPGTPDAALYEFKIRRQFRLRSERGAPAYVQRVNPGYEVRVDATGVSAHPLAVNLAESLAWLQHERTPTRIRIMRMKPSI